MNNFELLQQLRLWMPILAFLQFHHALANHEEAPVSMKSNANVGLDQMVKRSPRQKRNAQGTGFTEAQIQRVLDEHNTKRRSEPRVPSNMYLLTWNSFIADMAQEWAEACGWFHGFPDRDAGTVPFSGTLGQNLYFASGDLNIVSGVKAWYDEIAFYDFSSRTCQTGKPCGHYTQVVWGDSRELGCGSYRCPILYDEAPSTKTWSDVTLLVCHYGPAGNYPTDPYKVGEPCTACNLGQYFCIDGLCAIESECTKCNSGCECKSNAVCQNCASLSTDCTCQCQDGWKGDRCDVECVNALGNCNLYPNSYCEDGSPYQAWMRINCMVDCALCTPAGSDPLTCSAYTQVPVDDTSSCPTTTSETTQSGVTPTTTTQSEITSTTTQSGATPTTTTQSGVTTTTTAQSGVPTTTTTRSEVTPTTTTQSEITPTTTQSGVTPTTTTQSGVTTTTTTQSGETNACRHHVCQNGGSVRTFNAKCICTCTSKWYGDTCQHNVRERNYGVFVKVAAPKEKWPQLWERVGPLVANFLNSYCNVDSRFSSCCPDLGTKSSDGILIYATDSDIRMGKGFPVERLETSKTVTVALIYSLIPIDTPLCLSGTGNSARKRRYAELVRNRQRRNDDTLELLPQQVIYEALKGLEANLTSAMDECCEVEFLSISKPSPLDTNTYVESNTLPEWSLYVIGVAALAVMTVLVALVLNIVSKKCGPNKSRGAVADDDDALREVQRPVSVARKYSMAPGSSTITTPEIFEAPNTDYDQIHPVSLPPLSHRNSLIIARQELYFPPKRLSNAARVNGLAFTDDSAFGAIQEDSEIDKNVQQKTPVPYT
ncbi:unnamed protein product [Owenia fusiformis]|uniref:Uncharacterized protein n=1 Tax=Owenia fusiformis TaxID=6347 RepID=A0A8J1TSC8_OWEFU|nr:unnamed protein product [Owenia fusiformis]